MKRMITRTAMIAFAVMAFACSGELNRSASPVALIVTNTQTLQRIDISPTAANCNQDIATVNAEAVLRNPAQVSDQTFNRVRITHYTVSYARTDGGRQVPASFTRSYDAVLTPGGGATGLTRFQAFETGALSQAPFAALLPNNGGRDPETGRSVVQMDVILTLFGETLAGENVSGSTRLPLTFCFNCGGCA